MKKLVAVLLILMVLLMVGCKKQAETKDDDTQNTQNSLDEVGSINNLLDNNTESELDDISLENW